MSASDVFDLCRQIFDNDQLMLLGKPRELSIDALGRFIRHSAARLLAGFRFLSDVELTAVEFFEPYTLATVLHGGGAVVTVDRGLVQFIGLMNEALACGDESDTEARNLQVANVLFQHSVRTKPLNSERYEAFVRQHGLPLPFPAKPRGLTADVIELVSKQTALHVAFVIAHELAHISLRHVQGVWPEQTVEENDGLGLLIRSGRGSEVLTDLPAEISADAAAVEMCMTAFDASNGQKCATLLESIFQVSRYFMYLDSITTEPSRQLVVLRHFGLRSTLHHFLDRVPNPTCIVERLEWLEENAESGWATAADGYRRLMPAKSGLVARPNRPNGP